VKDFRGALEESRRPGVQAAFLLNPTRIEQLKAVADALEVMPQKSTFFFPKLASGCCWIPSIRSRTPDRGRGTRVTIPPSAGLNRRTLELRWFPAQEAS